jgi:hypothetical protein
METSRTQKKELMKDIIETMYFYCPEAAFYSNQKESKNKKTP